MENGPFCKWRLSEHLTLDLPVNITCRRFNVERIWSTISSGTHKQFACIVLETLNLLRCVFKLHVPEILLLDTFGILSK